MRTNQQGDFVRGGCPSHSKLNTVVTAAVFIIDCHRNLFSVAGDKRGRERMDRDVLAGIAYFGGNHDSF